MDALNHVIHEWIIQLGWTGDAVLRLLLAGILGALVGLEREVRGREAGFRTHLLVCFGSALVMLVSVSFADHPWVASGSYSLSIDPGRIAYGVMTGIGFLGAGAILKQQSAVRGLTTAASLWCVAAIGLACGFGLYVLAVAAAAMTLSALWLLHYLEAVLPRRRFRRLILRCVWHERCLQNVTQRIESLGISVEDQSFQRTVDLLEVDIELSISYTDANRYEEVVESLYTDHECRLIASHRS